MVAGLVVAGLVLGAGALAGCVGGDDDAGPDPGRGPGGTADDAPRQGGTFRVAVPRPVSLDPARARPVPQTDAVVADLLFDGLVDFEPQAGAVVPALAQRWQAEDGQRRWSFRLRAGARFADGSPVTAADVKATLERIAAPGSGSPVSVLLEPVRGYRAVALDGSTGDLAGVTAPRPDLVVVELDIAMSTFAEVLTNPGFGIVPASAPPVGADGFDPRMAGSGPFRLVTEADEADDVLRLRPAERRDTYVAGVDVGLHDDLDAAYEAFEAGEADWSVVPLDQVEVAGGRYGTTGFVPFAGSLFYGLNTRHPTLADVRFREAIVRAVDRRALVADVYAGTLGSTTALVSLGVPGAQDDPCGAPCRHDVDRARRLVAQAFPDGDVPTLGIDFDRGGRQAQVARAIADDLEAVGIPTELRPRPAETYAAFLAGGEQEVFRLGWTGGYPSPDAWLVPLFLSTSPDNVVGFRRDDVDDLLRRARAEPDESARRRLFAEAERVVLSRLPVVPLGQFRTHSVQRPRVRGLVLSVLGTFDATRVWLAADD